MFTFQQLKYFCEAYRAGSLNRAADALFLTRQALGKSLSALEREVGGQLFERGNDGTRATRLGEFLYPEARDIVERAEALFAQASQKASDDRYRLRIGSTFSALETTFPLLPISFAEACPNVVLDVLEAPDARLEEMVADGGLDGAFVIGPSAPSAGVTARCVHREGLGLLVRHDSPLAAFDSLRIEDVADTPLLVVGSQFKVHRQLMDAFAAHGCEPCVRYTSNDFSLLVKMCEMGEGAVPLPISRRASYEGLGLVLVPFAPGSDPGWRIDFIARESAEGAYALAAFEDFLAQVVRATR